MKSPWLILMVTAALGMTGASGCGGQGGGGQGGGGTAGTGGASTSAAGGSGGTGGTGASAGSTTTGVACEAFPYSFTFYPQGAGEGVIPMTITTLESQLIVMAPVGGGEPVTLDWRGADLTQHFTLGDAVTLENSWAGDAWIVITGDTTFAAAWHEVALGAVLPPPLPAPYGGPSFDVEYLCTEGTRTALSLIATAGADTATVATGETLSVGPYLVHNGGCVEHQTDSELSSERSASVVGPVPP